MAMLGDFGSIWVKQGEPALAGIDRLISAYVEGLDLVGVWAGRMPDGSVRIGHASDPSRGAATVRAELLASVWCGSERHAEAMVRIAREISAGVLPTVIISQNADNLRAILLAGGRELGIPIGDDTELLRLGIAAVTAIELELKAAQASGSLKPINQSFKTQRAAALAAGRGFQSYNTWFFGWKVNLVKAAARRAALSIAGPLHYQTQVNLAVLMDVVRSPGKGRAAPVAAEAPAMAIGDGDLAGMPALRTA